MADQSVAAETRVCTLCKLTKPLTAQNFGSLHGKYLMRCKPCKAAAATRYKRENRERILARRRELRLQNRDAYNARRRAQHADPEFAARMNSYRRAYERRNPEKTRERANNRYKLCTPPQKVSRNLGSCIVRTLKIGKGGARWSAIVGYTLEQLRTHLERQFAKGMTWDNYGRHGWHVDHIIPVSAFVYESSEDPDFKACWALTNLRPLWAAENISKNAKRTLLL